jgi:ElaB/YqjD/DUF883 family membrane-anchored ribosome-binding protein
MIHLKTSSIHESSGVESHGASGTGINAQELWQKARRQLVQIEEAISANPGASVAAAIAVGIVLGWWMKRR